MTTAPHQDLNESLLRVFYDAFEQADLWGKDLYEHLFDVYAEQSRYCILLVSRAYAEKMWTVHERRAAQERVLKPPRVGVPVADTDRRHSTSRPAGFGGLSGHKSRHCGYCHDFHSEAWRNDWQTLLSLFGPLLVLALGAGGGLGNRPRLELCIWQSGRVDVPDCAVTR